MFNQNDPNNILAKNLKKFVGLQWKPDVTDTEDGKKKVKFNSIFDKETFLLKLNSALINNPDYKEIVPNKDNFSDNSVTLSKKDLNKFLEFITPKTSKPTITESNNISAEVYDTQAIAEKIKKILDLENAPVIRGDSEFPDVVEILFDDSDAVIDFSALANIKLSQSFGEKNALITNKKALNKFLDEYRPFTSKSNSYIGSSINPDRNKVEKEFQTLLGLQETPRIKDGKYADEKFKQITFNNSADKTRFINMAKKEIALNYADNGDIVKIPDDAWENFLVAVKLKNKYFSENPPSFKIVVNDDSDKPGLVGVTIPASYSHLNEIVIVKEIANTAPIYHEIIPSENKENNLNDTLEIKTYRSSLNEFLNDFSEPTLWQRIDKRIDYYKGKKDSFATESYKDLWEQKTEMLESTMEFLLHYLDSKNTFEKVLNALHDVEHTNHRWVEGPETRRLVEESKLLVGISPEIIELDTRIAERINEYKKNKYDEKDSLLYTDDSKLELWKHKVKVLKAAQEVLYANADTLGDKLAALQKAENTYYRWNEGSETLILVRDIKKEKGIPSVVIALDTRIANQINTYEKDIESTGNYILGLFGQDSTQIWKDNIQILKAAKAALYDPKAKQNFTNVKDLYNETQKRDTKSLTAAVEKHINARGKKPLQDNQINLEKK